MRKEAHGGLCLEFSLDFPKTLKCGSDCPYYTWDSVFRQKF